MSGFTSLHEHDIYSTPHATHEADSGHPPVHDDSWKEQRNLDAPPPRDGFTQRWIRFDDANGPDAKNSHRKTREGWRPRAVETLPQEYRNFPTQRHASLGDVIYVDGLVLCEMPIHLAQKRNTAVRERTERQNMAVNDETDRMNERLAGTQRGFGVIEKESVREVSVGGRTMRIQE